MANIIHLNTLLGIMIMIKDKQFLKDYNKICEKIEILMSIGFDSKTTYSDDDKYIKNKNKYI